MWALLYHLWGSTRGTPKRDVTEKFYEEEKHLVTEEEKSNDRLPQQNTEMKTEINAKCWW